MNKKRTARFLGFGGGTMLAAFGVLCLVVLAMLGITTVQSDRRQADASVQSVADFYTADRLAQNIYARLKLGEVPEGVEVDGDIYRYSCPVSDSQVLEVEVQKREDGWEVLRWQAVNTAEYGEETLPVWGGE